MCQDESELGAWAEIACCGLQLNQEMKTSEEFFWEG